MLALYVVVTEDNSVLSTPFITFHCYGKLLLLFHSKLLSSLKNGVASTCIFSQEN